MTINILEGFWAWRFLGGPSMIYDPTTEIPLNTTSHSLLWVAQSCAMFYFSAALISSVYMRESDLYDIWDRSRSRERCCRLFDFNTVTGGRAWSRAAIQVVTSVDMINGWKETLFFRRRAVCDATATKQLGASIEFEPICGTHGHLLCFRPVLRKLSTA